MISFDLLKELAEKADLHVVGVTDGAPLELENKRLKIWQENGYAGEMRFMQRDPEIFLSAETIITVAMYYESGAMPETPKGFGRVARYALSRDYHITLKKKLLNFAEHLKASFSELNYRAFTDAVPFLERAYAVRSGLGFIGKNTMLIRDKEGSFFVLGELLIDQQVKNTPESHIRGGCGTCSSCIMHCPTKAIVSPHQLDARRCISYLTIEKRGIFEEWEMRAVGEWIFGCDICQEVCPFNKRSQKKQSTVSPFVELQSIISIRDDKEFLKRFSGTPLMRAKRSGLIRNAISVALNTDALELRPDIENAYKNDSDAIIKSTASICLDLL